MSAFHRLRSVPAAAFAFVGGAALSLLTAVSSAGAQDIIISGFKSHNIVRCHGALGDCVEIVPRGRAGLQRAHCLEMGPDGALYVCSFGSGDVLKFDPRTGDFLGTFVPKGSGGLDIPTCGRFGPDGYFYVSNYTGHSVNRYDPVTGEFVDTFIWPRSGDLKGPSFLWWRGDGNVYVMSDRNGKIIRFDEVTGEYVDTYISEPGKTHPQTCWWPGDGYVYVDWYDTNEIRRYDEDTGEYVDSFIPNGYGGLEDPHGFTIGPDGAMYVVSSGTHSVLRYDAETGEYLGVAANPGTYFFREPTSILFVDEAEITWGKPFPLRAGEVNTFPVSGATPGREVYLLYGRETGLATFPICTGLNVKIEMPLVGGPAIADAKGNASIEVPIDASFAGVRTYLTAVEVAACLRSERRSVIFE